MLNKIIRRLRLLRSAGRLGSRRWATVIDGRYEASDFRGFPRSNDLYFTRFDLRATETDASLLLSEYHRAIELRDHGYLSLTYEGLNLIATLPGMKLRIQTSEEILILHELFVGGQYRYDFRGPTVVFDIGANVAAASLWFARHPGVTTIGFEPFRTTYNAALFNVGLNPNLSTKIKLRNVAVGKDDSTQIWPYSPTYRGSSGAFNMPRPTMDVTNEEVRVVDVAAAIGVEMERAGPCCRFIAKIDCEGGEYDVLDRLSETGLLERFTAVMIEWHRRGSHDPRSLLDVLASNGFVTFLPGPEHGEVGLFYGVRYDGPRLSDTATAS